MTESEKGRALAGWIRDWIRQNLALDGEIARDDTFVALGLDSVHAMMLVGDLEEKLGRRLPPTLAWDHPTLGAMAEHLAADLDAAAPAPATTTPPTDVDALSEAELDRLLRERLDPKDTH